MGGKFANAIDGTDYFPSLFREGRGRLFSVGFGVVVFGIGNFFQGDNGVGVFPHVQVSPREWAGPQS